MIQRYGQDVYGIILKDPDGQIVLWDDHRAAITPLARALRETLAAAVILSDIGCSGAEYRSAKSKFIAVRALLDEYKGIA
jgi:type IV secretory pathway TrbF-like protein